MRLTAIRPYGRVLAEGAEKARAIARPNMDAIKDILGLVRIAPPNTTKFKQTMAPAATCG